MILCALNPDNMLKMLRNASFLPFSPQITLLSFNKQQHKTVSDSSVPTEGIQVLNEHLPQAVKLTMTSDNMSARTQKESTVLT